MRAIQIAEPHKLRYVDISEPGKPEPGEALVQSHRMGVCGTDVSSYLGKFPFFDYPRIPGHELGVEVLEVGPGVTHLKPGMRCSVEPYMNCGQCYPCRRGNINCCISLDVIGIMSDGGLCERFRIPAHKLHPGDALSYEQLALVETLAIGSRASSRFQVESGEQVLIIGAGPIGLSTIEFVRLTGAEITVADLVESRLEFCRDAYEVSQTIRFGADVDPMEQILEITGGDLYPVVIDVTGNRHSMAAALNYLAPTGTLVYLGVTTDEIQFPHPLMHRREATIRSSRNALPADFTRIIELIAEGVIDTDRWITHRTHFDSAARDFESFTRPESGVIKAVIEVS